MTKENLKDRIRNYLSNGKLNLWDAIDLIAQYIDERIPPQKEKEWTTSQSIEKCSLVMLHSNPCTCKTNFDSCKTCGGSGFTNYRLTGDKKAKADKCPECNKPDSCEDEVGELAIELWAVLDPLGVTKWHTLTQEQRDFYKARAIHLINLGYSRHKKQEVKFAHDCTKENELYESGYEKGKQWVIDNPEQFGLSHKKQELEIMAVAELLGDLDYEEFRKMDDELEKIMQWEKHDKRTKEEFKAELRDRHIRFAKSICQSFSKPSKQEGGLDRDKLHDICSGYLSGSHNVEWPEKKDFKGDGHGVLLWKQGWNAAVEEFMRVIDKEKYEKI